jgi:hypothetical protein
LSFPCENGGTCTQGLGSFECTCVEGFQGDFCDCCDATNCSSIYSHT